MIWIQSETGTRVETLTGNNLAVCLRGGWIVTKQNIAQCDTWKSHDYVTTSF